MRGQLCNENDKCFACGRPLRAEGLPCEVEAYDDQTAYVGPDCYKRIVAAGSEGYQPPIGGPRLYKLGTKGK